MDTTTQRQTFGQQIRRYRRRAGLTQEELAERAELSPRGLIYLERGERHPQPGTIRRLADALGLSEQERSSFLADVPHIASEVRLSSALPLQPTPFIGREREVTAVMALLGREAVRLLTLTGPGGTGKTRLAVEVAAEVRDTFPDGAVFVSLAPIGDPGLVASAIATNLEIKETGDRPLLNILKASLGRKQLLLVLDNFEHLLPAAAVVGELLVACPRLVVLVTSRSCLHLAAEYEYPVPGMALPGEQHRSHLAVLARVDAVAFFLERARSITPDFALTVENASAIVAICHRLDGLPLAIELAAARIRIFPPQALLARLEHRLSLLTGGAKDRPSRQQTLRGAIDWSYSLLSKDEQSLFARLSVFSGGCSLEAAEAVCDPEGEFDLLGGMTSLVEQSLLWQEGENEPRFSMLETIREYATEKLAELGEVDEIGRRHGTYFLQMAEEAEAELIGPNQVVWLERLDAEHDNLRAALGWADAHGEGAIMLRIAAALAPFWHPHCYYTDARRWLRAALAAGGTEPTQARAKALYGLTRIVDDGELLMQESLAVFRALGDTRGMARALTILGNIARNSGELDRAEPLYQEALRLAREAGDRLGMSHPILNLGNVAQHRGDFDRAEQFFSESLALAREVGERHRIAAATANLAMVAGYRRDFPRAERLFHESLALFREIGNQWDTAHVQTEHAAIVLELGDAGLARRMCEDGLRVGRETGDTDLILPACEELAAIASVQGDPMRGVRLAAASAALRNAAGYPMPPEKRPRYERYLKALRSQLDESSRTTAWSEGEAMTLEEMAAYALGSTRQ